MLGDRAGKRLEKYFTDYVVFDLETTGVDTLNDNITEIAAVKVVNRKIVDEFSSFVNPLKEIPQRVVELTGISDRDVALAPIIDDLLKDFNDFIGDSILVGHSIHRFDLKLLYREYYRCYEKTLTNNYVDTLHYSKHLLKDMSHHSLAALCEHYEISNDGAHRALNDCRRNHLMYEKLGLEPPSGKESRICPECGDILLKKCGKHGKIFYSCATYPTCKYIEKTN